MDSVALFKNINNLIIALSNLLWPIVILIIILLFRSDISKLLTRVKKGKFFGQELELNVSEFQKTIKKAEQEVPELPINIENYNIKIKQLDSDISEILKASEINPEIGILRLSSILEKDIRITSASLGDLDTNKNTSAIKQFKLLLDRKRLPSHTSESLQIFWNLRNLIVHGKSKHDKHDILRILDIGLTLLKTIRLIPHETNIVYKSNVDLFEEKECTIIRKGVKGLILQTTSSDGKKIFKRIFPTTRSSYYEKDKQVSWEWNFSNVWNKTWYINPDTKEKLVAWDGACEFYGRYIDEI